MPGFIMRIEHSKMCELILKSVMKYLNAEL